MLSVEKKKNCLVHGGCLIISCFVYVNRSVVFFFFLYVAPCSLRGTVYSIQREYSVPSTSSGAACDQNSQQPSSQDRKVVDLTAAKFSGVGPVSQEGVPIALRSVRNHFIALKFKFKMLYVYYIMQSSTWE